MGNEPLVLIAVDLGWWRSMEAERFVREPVVDGLGLSEDRVILALSHTHSGPILSLDEDGLPGGDLVQPYLRWLRGELLTAAREAIGAAREGLLEWHTGRCALAKNRDLPDPAQDRYLCGFNPEGVADDALLIARLSGGGRMATALVNYACHPTTLGPENRRLSPDFVGAMRRTTEGVGPRGSPCLFVQGASGELAPREQYEGDPALAEGHGAHLGHAALATQCDMLPPGTELAYDRTLESGAPLAMYDLRARELPSTLRSRVLEVELPLRPASSEPETGEGAGEERLRRQRSVRRNVGEGASFPVRVWLWQVGEAFFVGLPGEAYSALQRRLRAAFPDRAVVCMNVANGWLGYFPPAERYGDDLYAVGQTPFARGCLERLIEACREALEEWTKSG